MSSVVALRSTNRQAAPITLYSTEPTVIPKHQDLAAMMLVLSALGITRYGSRSRETIAASLRTTILILGDGAGLTAVDPNTVAERLQRLPLARMRALTAAVLSEQRAQRYGAALKQIFNAAELEIVVDPLAREAKYCDGRRLEEARRLGIAKLSEAEPPLVAYLQRWIQRHDSIERLVASDERQTAEPAYGNALLRWSFAEWVARALVGPAPFVGYRVLNDRKRHLERIFRRRSLPELRATAREARGHFETGDVQKRVRCASCPLA
jgi:hypothetical protein